MSKQLKILTLNVWGLPDIITSIVYRHYKKEKRKWTKRTERIHEIGKKLKEYDIICFQEVWLDEDRRHLSNAAQEFGFYFYHCFSSGFIGSSGLVVLSKFPIKQAHFFRFRANGQALRFDHGDFHAGKGFGYLKFEIDNEYKLSLICTHTIAKYDAKDAYHADRVSQMWEIVRFSQHIKRDEKELFVLCGDLNCVPNSLEFDILTKLGNFQDSYFDVHKQYINGQLDYIFYLNSPNWKAIDSKITFKDDFLYSDHFGVATTFEFKETEKIANQVDKIDSHTRQLTKYASLTLSQGIEEAKKRKNTHSIRSVLAVMVLYVLASVEAPAYWIALATLVIVGELFVAIFLIESEIVGLQQAMEEINFHL